MVAKKESGESLPRIEKEVRDSECFKLLAEFNSYLLVSIGMQQANIMPPTCFEVLWPLPSPSKEQDDEAREHLEKLLRTANSAIFSNSWYGARSYEMIDAYLEKAFNMDLPGDALVTRHEQDSRLYILTERGEEELEVMLEDRDRGGKGMPHLQAVLDNIAGHKIS